MTPSQQDEDLKAFEEASIEMTQEDKDDIGYEQFEKSQLTDEYYSYPAWNAALEWERERVKREIEQLEAEIAELKDQIQVLVDGKFDQHIKSAATQKLIEALELIAAPKRPDGTYNRCREACEFVARQALAEYRGEIPESGEEE